MPEVRWNDKGKSFPIQDEPEERGPVSNTSIRSCLKGQIGGLDQSSLTQKALPKSKIGEGLIKAVEAAVKGNDFVVLE